MKTRFLFPHSWRFPAVVLLIPSSFAAIWMLFANYEPDWLNWNLFVMHSDQVFENATRFGFIQDNVGLELSGTIVLICLILLAFSADKTEDEFTLRLRYEALTWATLVNYSVIALSIWLIYGLSFLFVLIFNLFLILILFIMRFRYLIYKAGKTADHEE